MCLTFSLDLEPAECQRCSVRSHHLGVGLKFMLPSAAWPLITLFSCSLGQRALCLDLKESHPVMPAQLSMRLLNQERLFYRLLWNPLCITFSSTLPHKVQMLQQSRPVAFTATAQWHCHFAWAPISLSCTGCVLRQKAKAYMGITLFVSPSLEDYNFVSACCSMSQKQLRHVASVLFVVFSRWQVW